MAIHAAGDGDEPQSTIKFLCSYGGRILPRKPYGKLCYSGGFTRILSVHPSISYPELMARLAEFCGFSVVLRCQLPSCDLETLVTIKSDEDLANLVEEYRKESPRWPQKIKAVLSTTAGSPKVLPPPSSSSTPRRARIPLAATPRCTKPAMATVGGTDRHRRR
ncbi:hypothetical protein MLD38_032712 [Melastoma candidum]|uniref:Uncharacterized protein n=1 Tax=Melastoma candidum TaxID=119954 RepID=A0ACB9M5Q4_9MYRT|nr:hypothetical protein MLD38_032712 [Melastoma candidum]